MEEDKLIRMKVLSLPSYKWQLQIGKDGGLIIQFLEKDVPNTFHRKMQELILGFKWRKLL